LNKEQAGQSQRQSNFLHFADLSICPRKKFARTGFGCETSAKPESKKPPVFANEEWR